MWYFLDPFSIVFHPRLDARNNFQTVAYNWEKQNVLKVNQFGYEILKILDEKPGLSLDELCELVSQKYKTQQEQIRLKLVKFIEQMVKENVIKEKN